MGMSVVTLLLFSMTMLHFASRNHEPVWQYNMSAMPSARSRLRARACGDPGLRGYGVFEVCLIQ